MFFQCPPVGRRLFYLIPWTFIYKLLIQWKENSSKDSHSPRCDGALVCSSRLMITILLLMHNFIWIALIKINAWVIWDKKELMNSRDSIIVSLAEADLRQALLIVHFPISDVSPPLAYARIPHRYGCPFAHLLSACTCYIFQNFNDKNVAAHLKFEPHMSLSRRRKSLLLRSYDISAQFCAARLSLMTGLLIPNILQVFFEIRPHIF